MAKQFFIGASIALLVLLGLWGVYTLFFSSPKAPTTDTERSGDSPNSSYEVPVTEETHSVEIFFDAPVVSPFFPTTPSESLRYIDKNTGSLQEINTETGAKKVLSQETLVRPASAVWNRTRNEVIVKELKSNEPSFRFIGFDTNTSTPLKWGMRYVMWDELEQNLLYTYQDEEGIYTLNRSDFDGSNWKTITTFPSGSFFVESIPKSPFVASWPTPANTRIGELRSISIASGETKKIFDGKYGADYLWSPNGETILMSWAPEKGSSKLALATINKNGGEYTDLNMPTLVQKCVWSQDNATIFCALPGSLAPGTVMPDDFFKKTAGGNDTFWKINVKTGEKERVIALENLDTSYDAVDLLLDSSEKTLYFVNRKDEKLYKIAL